MWRYSKESLPVLAAAAEEVEFTIRRIIILADFLSVTITAAGGNDGPFPF